MIGFNHLLISGIATSLLLGTAEPAVVLTGAIAGLLPDVDVSTSPAGRLLPWISGYFESTMPHRSCTHSLMASAVVALAAYSISILILTQLLIFAHAVVIGYSFGWFADVFTRGGVEMFWPSPVRCVCPGNRNFRLRTGSSAEYVILAILVATAITVLSINTNGGLFNQFNRLIAAPSGVIKIYNESGSKHKIIANIKGVRQSDKVRVDGSYLIIKEFQTGFIVFKDGKLYKAGTDPDSQIFIESITADIGLPAITTIENLFLEDDPIGGSLAKFQRAGAMVFVSGQLSVDDFDTSIIPRDPYQFSYIQASPTTISLETAPLDVVTKFLGDEFATGSLQVRLIVSNL